MSQKNESPTPVFVMRGHNSPILALAFTPIHICSGDTEGNIFVWDLRTFRREIELKNAHERPINKLLFHQNFLLSQGRDAKINVWDLSNAETRAPVRTFETRCEAFGRFCSVYICNINDSIEDSEKNENSSLKDHNEDIPEKTTIVKSALAEELKSYADQSAKFEEQEKKASITLLKNTHYLAVPSDEQSQIDIFDYENASILKVLESGSRSGMCMVLSQISDSQFLAGGFEDGKIYVWNLMQNSFFPFADEHFHEQPIISMCFDRPGTLGISVGADTLLNKFSWNGKILKRKCKQTFKNAGAAEVALRNDEKIVGVANWDSKIRIYGWKGLKPLAILRFHEETVHAVAFDANSNLIASGGNDQRIALWRLY